MVPQTRSRLQVVLLAAWLDFPEGMAATARARLLALALREGGVEVRVVCPRAVSREQPGQRGRSSGGVWHGVPYEYPGGVSRRSSSFARRRVDDTRATVCTLARLLQLHLRGRLDCVYLYVAGQHWTADVVVLALLLRLLRTPVVIELNELPWTEWRTRSLVQRRRHPLAGGAGVVAISRYLASWARREARARHASLEVLQVPILVDLHEFPAAAGSPVTGGVLFAGDVSEQNLDVVRLIGEALRIVWVSRPSCRFTWVGADPGDPRLRGALPRGPDGALDERVHLPGFVPRDELLAMYREAAALLLPLPLGAVSVARFPTKLGEYLASRRPVITTDVGEVGEYLTDGESAFVAPPGDAGALAAAVLRVLDDPARAADVGEAGYRVAERHFHYARHSQALALFFRRCAEGRGA